MKFSRRTGAFSLAEIVVVVAIIALMAVAIVPFFAVSRKKAAARKVRDELALLDSAVQKYAVETQRPAGFHPVFGDLRKYLPAGSGPLARGGRDPIGNPYGPFTTGEPAVAAPKTLEFYSDVIEGNFWKGVERKPSNASSD